MIIRILKTRTALLKNYFWIKRHVSENTSDKDGRPHAVFDLKDVGLESYYCYLILSFIEQGYRITIKDNLWFIANSKSYLK